MAVNALDVDRLAVHQELAALHLGGAEADVTRNHLEDAPAAVAQRDQKLVEIRNLGGPFLGVRHGLLEVERNLAAAGRGHRHGRQRGRLGPIRVIEHRFHRGAGCLRAIVPHLHVQLQRGVAILPVERRGDPEIADMQFRNREQEDLPEDAAESPEVLVLEIGPVGEAVHLGRQHVLARLQIAGDIELGRRPAALAVTDLLPVDPDVHGRFDPGEVQEDLPAGPVSRHGERPPVGADRVVPVRDVGRVLLERIDDVCVVREVIALHLPVGWHGNLGPVADVIRRLKERGRTIGGLLDEVELPGAVQAAEVRRVVPVSLSGGGGVGIDHQRGVAGLLVPPDHLRVFPIIREGRRKRGAGEP